MGRKEGETEPQPSRKEAVRTASSRCSSEKTIAIAGLRPGRRPIVFTEVATIHGTTLPPPASTHHGTKPLLPRATGEPATAALFFPF